MADHNDLGAEGERMALQHLQSKGYTILETNWNFGKEEIDIIARIGGELVVVEVKTRNSNFFGEPEEFVSKAKQRHMIKAANAYVEKYDLDVEVRFDVIGIILNRQGKHINHLEAAFLPRW